MNTVIEQLGEALGSLDTIVCLGIGTEFPVDTLLQFGARRIVLADADQAEAGYAAQTADSIIEMYSIALAADAGQIDWYSYNIRGLNGPRNAASLLKYFPRLRAIPVAPRVAVAVEEWIGGLRLSNSQATGAHLLILNLPGQELSLLRGIKESTLSIFDRIVICGCSDVEYAGDSLPESTATYLSGRAFYPLGKFNEETLWPCVVMALDQRKYEFLRLQENERVLSSHIEEMNTLLRNSSAEADRLRAENQSIRAELAAVSDRLRKAETSLSDDERKYAEVQAITEHANSEIGRLLEAVGAKDAVIANFENYKVVTENALAEQAFRIRELTLSSDELHIRVTSLAAEVESLTGALDAESSRVLELRSENANLVDRHRSAESEIDRLTAAVESLNDERTATGIALDEVRRDLESVCSKLPALTDNAVDVEHSTEDTRELSDLLRAIRVIVTWLDQGIDWIIRTKSIIECDLEELRERYTEILRENDEAAQILGKILDASNSIKQGPAISNSSTDSD